MEIEKSEENNLPQTNCLSPSPCPSSISTTPDSKSDTPPRSTGASDKRPPRQMLRTWLIDQINKGDIPGLMWLDQDELKFKIPWKHFGRSYEAQDAELFRRWAINTNKFQEGYNLDVSAWKTRLRCALHKSEDIEELPEFNQKDGDHPYRAYRFLSDIEITLKHKNVYDKDEKKSLNESSIKPGKEHGKECGEESLYGSV